MASLAVHLVRAPINIVASVTGFAAAVFSKASFEWVQITDTLWGIAAEAPGVDASRVILYFHGGGHWLLTPVTYKEFIGRLSAATGAKVVAVDYRKPPTVSFPAGLEDALDAWRWACSQLPASGGSVAVAGDSSGANLAFALVVKLAQLEEPMPVACIGISPWLRLDLERSLGNAYGRLCARMYLGGSRKVTTAADPLITITNAPKELVRRFPPVLMHAGSNELTTEDVKDMTRVLEECGQVHEAKFYDCPHIFQVGPGFPESSKDSLARISLFLQAHWRPACTGNRHQNGNGNSQGDSNDTGRDTAE